VLSQQPIQRNAGKELARMKVFEGSYSRYLLDTLGATPTKKKFKHLIAMERTIPNALQFTRY
jgi:hypothetical protein